MTNPVMPIPISASEEGSGTMTKLRFSHAMVYAPELPKPPGSSCMCICVKVARSNPGVDPAPLDQVGESRGMVSTWLPKVRPYHAKL